MFWECKLQKNCDQTLFGPVKIPLELIHTSYSLPKTWQGVKLTFCASCTCNALPFIHFHWNILFVTNLCRFLRTLSKSQNWLSRLWKDQSFWQWNRLFPRALLNKTTLSYILFRIWLIWLDSFDSKWNSYYNGNGLAGQFRQMESALSL